MVRVDLGVRWGHPGKAPLIGTVAREVYEHAAIPGPAQYNIRAESFTKGGIMNRGPMRFPTPPDRRHFPGPAQYVLTDPIEVDLPGYVPLHLRKNRRHTVSPEPPPTGKVWLQHGGRTHLVSLRNAHMPSTLRDLSRPTHTSNAPGARLIAPIPKAYRADPYRLPMHTRQTHRGQGRSHSTLGFCEEHRGMSVLDQSSDSMMVGRPTEDNVSRRTFVHASTSGYSQKHTAQPKGMLKAFKSGTSSGRAPSLLPTAWSRTSFGGTTEFRYEHDISRPAASRKHQSNKVHALWPESRKGMRRKKTENFQPPDVDGDQEIRGDSERRMEPISSPDSSQPYSPEPQSPSWAEKPRIGFLFHVEDSRTPRYGGAPQLTTHITPRPIPTPSRFRTPPSAAQEIRPLWVPPDSWRTQSDHTRYKASLESTVSGGPDETFSGEHRETWSHCLNRSPIATGGARKTPGKPKSSHRVSMHPSLSPSTHFRGDQEVLVLGSAPGSPEQRTVGSHNPLRFVSLGATVKDNVRTFQRTFM